MTSADDVERVDHSRKSTSRVLPVASRGADRVDDLDLVVGLRLDRLCRIKKCFGFDRRLRDDERISQPRQTRNFCLVADHECMIWCVTFNTDHLRMIRTSDHDHMTILLGGACGEFLNACDKRTSRV